MCAVSLAGGARDEDKQEEEGQGRASQGGLNQKRKTESWHAPVLPTEGPHSAFLALRRCGPSKLPRNRAHETFQCLLCTLAYPQKFRAQQAVPPWDPPGSHGQNLICFLGVLLYAYQAFCL